MGNILKKNGKYNAAISSYRQAIYYKSDFYQAMNEIGNIYRIKGSQKDAFSAYNDAISVNSKSLSSYQYISVIRKFKIKDKYITEMESLLNYSDVSQSDKIILNFSLGKAYEDLKQCLHFYQSNRPVLTASIAQVRRPFYRDSIELWRKYEKNIKKYFKYYTK